MDFIRSRQGNFVVWSRSDLTVVGYNGTLTDSLESVRKKWSKLDSVEVAPPRSISSRRHIALFSSETPSWDATLMWGTHANGNAGLVVYGLTQESAFGAATRLIPSISFVSKREPGRDFISAVESGLPSQPQIEERSGNVSFFGCSVSRERAFSATRYARFLQTYKEFIPKNAVQVACERFHICYQ